MPVVGALAVFLLIAGFFGLNLFRFKQSADQSAPKIYQNFKQGAQALFDFDIDEAKQSFEAANKDLDRLNAQAPLNTVPAILGGLFRLSQTGIAFSDDLNYLKNNGLALMLNKKGAFLVERFNNLKKSVAEIGKISSELKEQAANAGYEIGPDFDAMNAKLSETDRFLAAFLNWLEAPKKQRLVIFFQNPSEIRPTGGFIGSYGHATLFQGNLLDLEVRDIYDPDGQLDLKVVPPKALQGITGKWGARDANWFFDFPTSAGKVLEFLEASKIYGEQGIKFGGALAVNIEVLRDILEVLGPMDVTEYRLTIDKDNFLAEIQKEVESGDDKTQGQPKRILKVLTPLIFQKLANLSEDQKTALIDRLGARFAKKDILAYFKEPVLEEYLKSLGVAGEVLPLPEGFFGDYLAVVNSNVAGGKSDAFVTQKIWLTSKFEPDGRIRNKLQITRSHGGKGQEDWWYRSTNHDYLQVFAPFGAKLLKISGATQKTVKPLVDYAKSDFVADPDLSELEKAKNPVFGKSVFTAWLEVKAGDEKTISFEYFTPSRFQFQPGAYRFVFEKQSGVAGDLELELKAPGGYRWKESGSVVFSYATRDFPARIILDLNLEADRP